MCDKGGGNRSQAPKIVGVVGLSDSAVTSQVSNFILQGADEIEIPHSVSGTFDNVFSIKLYCGRCCAASGQSATELFSWMLQFA